MRQDANQHGSNYMGASLIPNDDVLSEQKMFKQQDHKIRHQSVCITQSGRLATPYQNLTECIQGTDQAFPKTFACT